MVDDKTPSKSDVDDLFSGPATTDDDDGEADGANLNKGQISDLDKDDNSARHRLNSG